MAYITFQPSDYFNTKLFTGNGSTNAITGVGFQPDWVWIKDRASTEHHNFFDAVRGATKRIYSSSTAAQDTAATTLTAFNTDGFTLGSSAAVNASGNNTVSWNWKAGGAGSSNTDGSINSTVSANTTSGFSIVKYGDSTGTQTVGHGLGSDVKVLIIKNLTSTNNWHVWHTGIPTSAIHLNETGAKTDSWFSTYQNSTAPTSSVFTVKSGGGDDTLGSSKNYIAYCFAEKTGFSKFGSYTGNGNSNGPFIFTGFKPGFLLIKNTSATEAWYIMDIKRPGYNTNNYYLKADDYAVEGTSTSLATSLLSNGFKIENSDTSMNTDGQNYIYMAFAEEPLVSSNNIPATAR